MFTLTFYDDVSLARIPGGKYALSLSLSLSLHRPFCVFSERPFKVEGYEGKGQLEKLASVTTGLAVVVDDTRCVFVFILNTVYLEITIKKQVYLIEFSMAFIFGP